MAKKANRPSPAVEVSPGANPYAQNKAGGRRLGTILGAICMILFVVTDELWVGTLGCALGFAIIYGLQVFVEKSKSWYGSFYLYAVLASLALAWVEYRYDFITELMKLN